MSTTHEGHHLVPLSTGHVVLALLRYCTYTNATTEASAGTALICDLHTPLEVVRLLDADAELPPDFSTGLAMTTVELSTMALLLMLRDEYCVTQVGRVMICLRRDSELARLSFFLQNSAPQYPRVLPAEPRNAVRWLMQALAE